MRAMVTGACGFVGRYLVRELAANGYEILATDRYDRPPPHIVGEIETGVGGESERISIDGTTADLALPAAVKYRGCNLLDSGAITALVEEWRPEAVVHLAAQSSAGVSYRDPRGTLGTNIFGTLNLLEAVRG